MNSSRFERMIGIPEDEYMHLKSLQQVYNPLQNKFQSLSNEYNKQQVIADPYVRNQRQGETLNSMIQMKDDIRQQLVQVTPKPYQSRAENLFNFISNKLTTNGRGEIIDSDGKVIEGSNIADLIQHAVRDRRRNIIPPGWETFKNILKDSNAPRMILNYDTLEEMQSVKTPSTVTPKPASRASRSRTKAIPKLLSSSSSSNRGATAVTRTSLPPRTRVPPRRLDDYLPSYKKKARGKSSAARTRKSETPKK